MREIKEILMRLSSADIGTKITHFGLMQDILQYSRTGRIVAEMIIGKRLLSLLDSLHAGLKPEMLDKQERLVQKVNQKVWSFEEVEAVNIGMIWVVPSRFLESNPYVRKPVSYKVHASA